jgi:carboxyl-terminal processing protease
MGHASSDNFNIQMKLSLSGIGAQLEESLDGDCKIKELVPEGPAAKSGRITNDDTIVAVAQKDQEPVPVAGMPLLKVVGMIRGPLGTPVTLTILKAHPTDPSARQETVTLVRDIIKLEDQAAKAKLYEMPTTSGAAPTRIGVIDLPSFYADTETDKPGDPPREHPTTSKDLTRIITRLKKENVDGIILDLRRNGGGFLDEAIRLTGLFATGPVVQTREPDEGPARPGEIEVESSAKGLALYDGPLILLTSRFSASASEIVAGALQDYGRALIVGDTATFGKGTVQTVQPMSNFMARARMPFSYDPGSIKVTIKKFYRAGGASTQSNGVASDIVLPSELNYAEVGENALPNPLPWDEISSADGLPDFNLVKPYLPELLKRSLNRRQTDKDFAYLQEDIDEYRKTLADKSVSLDEAERLSEQRTNEARQEARKKERASRPKSGEAVYEITMKNVDLAGLRAPEVKPKPAPAAADNADPLDAATAAVEDPAAADPALTETRRIMADYISLLKKPLTAAAAAAASQ